MGIEHWMRPLIQKHDTISQVYSNPISVTLADLGGEGRAEGAAAPLFVWEIPRTPLGCRVYGARLRSRRNCYAPCFWISWIRPWVMFPIFDSCIRYVSVLNRPTHIMSYITEILNKSLPYRIYSSRIKKSATVSGKQFTGSKNFETSI